MTDFQRDLLEGNGLEPGDNLFSATRNFRLTMQADGNLVLYVIDDATLPLEVSKGQYTRAIVSSDTSGNDGARLVVARGGLLLETNRIIWMFVADDPDFPFSLPNEGAPPTFLRLQDDGNLVLLDGGGVVLASSGTNAGRHG